MTAFQYTNNRCDIATNAAIVVKMNVYKSSSEGDGKTNSDNSTIIIVQISVL